MTASDIPEWLQRRVPEAAGNRCGYGLSAQRYVMGALEVEHIIPRALGGSDDELNLWLSCGLCNRYKGVRVSGIDSVSGQRVPLFNPRTQKWSEQFKWSADGTLIKMHDRRCRLS